MLAVNPPSASKLLVARRLVLWIAALVRLSLGSLLDRLRGRHGSRQLGRRLAAILRSMGGAAPTMGRLLSIRLDLFEPDFCQELRRVPDSGPALPIDHVIDRVEAAVRAPLDSVFQRFDPDPVGCYVNRCVYQASLKSGLRVAVQVRRPGADLMLDADLRAVGLLIVLLEQSTLARPGTYRNLRHELRAMAAEETDFQMRAQVTTMYRREARKDRLRFVTATRVLRQYVTADVIVNEFVSGVFLYEVLGAVERGDYGSLLAQSINPRRLAKRLLHAHRWGVFENLFYFSNPQPTNIVVRPRDKIVLLDFAENGWTNRELRQIQRSFEKSYRAGDISVAADLLVQSILPLPHVDIHELTKKIEHRLWHCYYGLRCKSSAPFERTSSAPWLVFLEVVRRRRIPVPLPTLRMVHTALLYDELVCRLWPRINGSTWRDYVQKASLRRVRRQRRDRKKERRPEVSAMVQDLLRRGEQVVHWLNSTVSGASIEFISMASKGAYISGLLLRLLVGVGFAAFAVYGLQVLGGQNFSGDVPLVKRVLLSPAALTVFGVALALTTRLIFFRLNDLDPGD